METPIVKHLPEPTPVAVVAAQLRALGVVEGDTLIVHASLRRLGPVEGRAGGVIRAIDEAVGAGGSWLMVLGARDDWAWVNQRPEQERENLLKDADAFDPIATPAQPDVGALAEVLRITPGTVVSDHPEGRFGARGRRALHLVSNVPWDDYYGPGSPLERLIEAGGKVLRLGADPDTTTLAHYAEYLADIADKRRVRRYRRVQGPSGPMVRVVECLDDEHGIVERPGGSEDYFISILRDFYRTHPPARGLVGRAASELFDARPFVAFAVAWMTTHLGRQSG